jgi:hypothetical protein
MTWARGPQSTFRLPIFDKAILSATLCLTAKFATHVCSFVHSLTTHDAFQPGADE